MAKKGRRTGGDPVKSAGNLDVGGAATQSSKKERRTGGDPLKSAANLDVGASRQRKEGERVYGRFGFPRGSRREDSSNLHLLVGWRWTERRIKFESEQDIIHADS